jgi:hypothetical protein
MMGPIKYILAALNQDVRTNINKDYIISAYIRSDIAKELKITQEKVVQTNDRIN